LNGEASPARRFPVQRSEFDGSKFNVPRPLFHMEHSSSPARLGRYYLRQLAVGMT
jgi:hypothetical protein